MRALCEILYIQNSGLYLKTRVLNIKNFTQRSHRLLNGTLLCLCSTTCNTALALDWRGNASTELTVFPEESVGIDNWNVNASIAAEVELNHDITDQTRITVHPFVRGDFRDNERSRAGLRELLISCLLYTSPSPRDQRGSRMPSSA